MKSFNVTAGDTITASYLAGSGFGGSSGTTTQKITARPLTVTAVTSTKSYDGTTAAMGTPTITAGTLVSGDTAAFSNAFVNKNAGTGKTLTVGGSVNDGNSGSNYVLTVATNTTGLITALALTVTATPTTKIYDGSTSSATAPTIAAGTLATGDTAAFSETYSTKNVGTGMTLAAGGSVNDGNSGSNYTVTFNTGTGGSITARAITVTAAATTKSYDGSTSSATAPTVTSGSLVGSDTPAFSETFSTENVGTGLTLTAAAPSTTAIAAVTTR